MVEDTVAECNLDLVVRLIDEALVEFGYQSLLDGDKVRDKFLDMRNLITNMAPKEAV